MYSSKVCFIPHDARILIDLGIAVIRRTSGVAAVKAIKFGPDGVRGARPDPRPQIISVFTIGSSSPVGLAASRVPFVRHFDSALFNKAEIGGEFIDLVARQLSGNVRHRMP